MTSSKTLRITLLFLFGFVILCLVVMEIIVSKRYPNLDRMMHPLLGWSFRSATSSVLLVLQNLPEIHQTSSGIHQNASGIHRGLSDKGPSSKTVHPNSSLQGFWNSSKFSLDSSNTSGNSLGASLSIPPATDHCKQAHQMAGPKVAFSLEAQTENGTRRASCRGCFPIDFPPLIENCGVCNTGGGGRSHHVDVVMMIFTTHRATDKRQAIRDTWASVTRNNTAHVRHVFLLGRAKAKEDEQIVRDEHVRHRDVIMYDFMDSYGNLTLKTMTAMRWAVRFCNNSRFVLKVDDDMWINVPSLLDTMKQEEASLQTAVGGACSFSAKPIRNPRSKWYASKKAYPQKDYPGFCSGTSYVTSLNVVRHVTSVSPNVPFFYLEDVYVSLCIQKLGPPFRLQKLKGFLHGGGSPCILRSRGTVSVHQVKPRRLREIWRAKCP